MSIAGAKVANRDVILTYRTSMVRSVAEVMDIFPKHIELSYKPVFLMLIAFMLCTMTGLARSSEWRPSMEPK